MKSPPAKASAETACREDFAFAGPSVKDKKVLGDGTGIGLRKDDAELKAAFDKALGEMRKDGTYDKWRRNTSILTCTATQTAAGPHNRLGLPPVRIHAPKWCIQHAADHLQCKQPFLG